MYEYTDRRNRTLSERVNAVAERRPDQGTEQDRAAATALLADMLRAAAQHGLTLDTFDWVTDLPSTCYRAVARHRDLSERVNAVAERRPDQGTEQDKVAATALLADILQAAAKHGLTLDTFDWVTDLPSTCYRAVVRHRDLTERIDEAAQRRTTPGTEEQKAAATALLTDMLRAAAQHGVTLDTFDWVADLPGHCYAAVVSPLHTRTARWVTAS
ncbi:hypothetical protein [Kitasatospora sp. NPDC051164]|uniref:hypothetical protein n=1 Tax=Kitasatospora sp. NPDC051164 TaxID=3364055 RepID=UPI003788C7AE